MKFIKLFIISIVVLFSGITLISLFMPSQVQISKAITMQTNEEDLWQVIDDFSTWEKWNSLLPGLSLRNPEYTSESIKAENVIITWKEKHPGLRIAAVKQTGKKKLLMGWKLQAAEKVGELTVQCYMDIGLRWYPWEKFAGMIYEKYYRDELTSGLTALKEILENKSAQ
jgi:hypothetical protein